MSWTNTFLSLKSSNRVHICTTWYNWLNAVFTISHFFLIFCKHSQVLNLNVALAFGKKTHKAAFTFPEIIQSIWIEQRRKNKTFNRGHFFACLMQTSNSLSFLAGKRTVLYMYEYMRPFIQHCCAYHWLYIFILPTLTVTTMSKNSISFSLFAVSYCKLP